MLDVMKPLFCCWNIYLVIESIIELWEGVGLGVNHADPDLSSKNPQRPKIYRCKGCAPSDRISTVDNNGRYIDL